MDSARARELLARERAAVEQALRENVPAGGDEPATETDMADQASDTFDAELTEGLGDDLRVRLAAVERAEQRLADGTYGRSVESGDPIPDERLEAFPTAERTAEEQSRFERGR